MSASEAMNLSEAMNTLAMQKLQLCGALASPPPGAWAGARVQPPKIPLAPDAKAAPQVPMKVSFAPGSKALAGAEANVPPEVPRKVALVASSSVLAEGPRSCAASAGFHCVHCGTKVPEKLIGIENNKFCVHCGKQHPESVLAAAMSAAKERKHQPESLLAAAMNSAKVFVPVGEEPARQRSLLESSDALRSQRALMLACASWRHLQGLDDASYSGCQGLGDASHFSYQGWHGASHFGYASAAAGEDWQESQA